MSLADELQKIADANVERAAEFARRFPGLKVTHCGAPGNVGMAAHHNAETGWGFTAQFVTTPDMKQHLHAWVEFTGPDESVDAVAEQMKKIVGG